jgi:hypothetical protein
MTADKHEAEVSDDTGTSAVITTERDDYNQPAHVSLLTFRKSVILMEYRSAAGGSP